MFYYSTCYVINMFTFIAHDVTSMEKYTEIITVDTVLPRREWGR